MKTSRMVALLRGINVGGKRIVPMAELRAVAEKCGLANVATYIQSGNLVFDTSLAPAAVEDALERAIEKRFGFAVEVIVRTADAWKKYVTAGAFPDAEKTRPQFLHLALPKAKPQAGAAVALAERAAAGERVVVLGDALFIDFVAGVGKSKLTPAVLDRAVGSTVTARNWKTVLELHAMLRPV